ncbi:MAG TPA: hypothetical protein VMG41_03130 [Gemmatimonadales bacterium]|nr:hypothetical protein [Gemmatimonadales bacterium]
MTIGEPFDSGRDPALGELLRRHFEAADHDAFAALVMARLPQGASLWDVLARWARPGIAAAVLIAAALGYWTVARETAQSAAEPTGELAAAGRSMDTEALMGAVLGRSR